MSNRSGFVMAAMLLSTSAAIAADDKNAAATPAAQTAANASTTAAPLQQQQALRAVRDKATGKLRAPSQEELESMLQEERAQRRARGEPEVAATSAQPLSVRRHASGMRSAVLGPEYLVTVQGKRAADGSMVQTHADPAHEHPTPAKQHPTE